MELLQLRYFLETAKNENVTKTAQKFMVSVPSVSASIKKLEQELGSTLFDRSSNRITLNKNGEQFLKSVSVIFTELESARHKISVNVEDTREINILVLALRGVLIKNIVKFKKTYPNIAFKTIFDFSEKDYSNYDIIIGEKSENMDGYESFEVINTRLRIAASKNSPLCGKKLSLKDLEGQDFVSMGENNDMQKTLRNACKKVGFTPNVIVQCNDILCFDRCMQEGIGIGVVREIKPESYTSQIDYLDISDFNFPYVVHGFYKKQAYYGNVKKFIDFLLEK